MGDQVVAEFEQSSLLLRGQSPASQVLPRLVPVSSWPEFFCSRWEEGEGSGGGVSHMGGLTLLEPPLPLFG